MKSMAKVVAFLGLVSFSAGSLLAQTLDHISVSQLGYIPDMKKEFTSPVSFTAFGVVREPDNIVVYSGGGPARTVTTDMIASTPATVYIGDFSTFTTPGRYKIVAGGMESFPFNIGTYVYDSPLRAAQRMFYYQRAFTSIDMQYAEGPWVHLTDIAKAPAGVVKGWHDAGDLAVYMPTMCQSLFWLMETWSDFQPADDNLNIPESGDGVPDLLNEIRWGVEWVKSMQDPNGGFWGAACPNCNNSGYNYGTTTPTSIGTYCKVIAPTTQNSAKAVAVLAYASVVFRDFDPSFANGCLIAARSGWTWMTNNPRATRDGGSCGNYAQGTGQALLKTNRSWAHAAMWYATGEQQFNTAFVKDYVPTEWISSYRQSEAFANRLYLRSTGGDAAIKSQIVSKIYEHAGYAHSDALAHPFRFATAYYWGCNSNAMHRSGQFSWTAYVLNPTRTEDRDQLLNNVNYIFGRNFLNEVYLSGGNLWGATRYRVEGFHQWLKALHTTPYHFPGALAGGPNQAPDGNDVSYPDKLPYPVYGYFGDPRSASGPRINNVRSSATPLEGRFTDNDSWSTNEIAINWNAALLYNLYAARQIARLSTTPPDGTPPTLINVALSSIAATSCVVTWTTDEPANAIVEYGPATSYGSTMTDPAPITGHEITLNNLAPGTPYSYRVKSVDPAGNSSNFYEGSFITGGVENLSATATAILQGTPVAGSTPANLLDNDGSYYKVYSTTSGSIRKIDWTASTTVADPATVRGVTITYDGSYSKYGNAQTLYVWDCIAGIWYPFDSRTLDVTDATVTFASTEAGRWVSLSTGEIKLRVFATANGGARYCLADYIKFRIERAGSIAKRSELTGSSNVPSFRLEQNYPNPFNPTTRVRFALPRAANVLLEVCNTLGQRVRTLVNEMRESGYYDEVFDASGLASGVYFYRLQAGDFAATRKLIVVR